MRKARLRTFRILCVQSIKNIENFFVFLHSQKFIPRHQNSKWSSPKEIMGFLARSYKPLLLLVTLLQLSASFFIVADLAYGPFPLTFGAIDNYTDTASRLNE